MLNKVQLIGNLGKNPEIRHLDSGVSVANFTLATSEKYKNKAGEKIEITDWHNIVVWGKLVDIIEKYLSKGDQIYIEGKLKTRSYENSGVKKYITEVVLEQYKGELKILSSSGGENQNMETGNQEVKFDKPGSKYNVNDIGTDNEEDNDLPF